MRRLPRFPLPIALMIVLSLGASAQDAPIYQRGYTVTENTMPPSPEPASAVKYADVPVTLSQGLVHYEIPFYTLQGRELSVPISLSYTSGGIKLNEIAGVAETESSSPTPGIEKVDPNLLGKVKAQVNWHTHPSNEPNSTTPSGADKEFKEIQ